MTTCQSTRLPTAHSPCFEAFPWPRSLSRRCVLSAFPAPGARLPDGSRVWRRFHHGSAHHRNPGRDVSAYIPTNVISITDASFTWKAICSFPACALP